MQGISRESKKELNINQKYRFYEMSVQNPDFDIQFFEDEYQKFYKKSPITLREDFCGTGLISCKWVQSSPIKKAIGIDLDNIPIKYGVENHFISLAEDEKKRMIYLNKDVLESEGYKADVVAALNFSYSFFKKRSELLQYFKSVRNSINKEGIFVLDILGGFECNKLMIEETDHDDFSYFWDCDKFNPITNEVLYKIDFKKKGERFKYKDVFIYDWRLWTIQELREIMEEAGFSKSIVYWEGDDGDGGGDGNFGATEVEENCESWVSYIVALP